MFRTSVYIGFSRFCHSSLSDLFVETRSWMATISCSVRANSIQVVSFPNEEFYATMASWLHDETPEDFGKHHTSRLFSITSKMKSQWAPGTLCRMGTRWTRMAVMLHSTSSPTSSSDDIQRWQVFTTLTARCCGRKMTSESESGAIADSRCRISRPSVSAFVAGTPSRLAANSFR